MKQSFFFSLDQARVNPRDGVIYGVSLISQGEAKGHEMFVDETTLTQVLQHALSAGSIKVKADHGSGVFNTIGYVDNFAMGNGKVIGDLHIYESEPEKPRIFEIASKNPNHMGISIEFEGDAQKIGTKKFARCEELMTAALVSDPAANKSLFEKKMYIETDLNNKQEHTMKKNFEAGTNESGTDPLVAFGEKLDEIMSRLSKLEEPATDTNEENKNGEAPKAINPNTAPATKDDELRGEEFADQENSDDQKGKMKDDEKKDVAEMAAKKAVEVLASKIGISFGRNAGPINLDGITASKDAKTKTFQQLLDEKTEELEGDHVKAMLFCLKVHKKQYALWRPVKPDTNKLAR